MAHESLYKRKSNKGVAKAGLSLFTLILLIALLFTVAYAWSLPFTLPFFNQPPQGELFLDLGSAEVSNGQPLTYSISLSNRGSEVLRDVTITDNFGEVGSLQALPPDEEFSLHCTTPILTAPLMLNVSAFSGSELLDQATAYIDIVNTGLHPALQAGITVLPSESPGTLVCRYTLINSGDDTLSRIKLIDGEGRLRGILSILKPGQKQSLLLNMTSSSLEGSEVSATDSRGQEIGGDITIRYPTAPLELEPVPVQEPVQTPKKKHKSSSSIVAYPPSISEAPSGNDTSIGAEIVPSPSPSSDLPGQIKLELTANQTRAYQGSTVSYVCTLKNIGQSDLRNLSLTCGEEHTDSQHLAPGQNIALTGTFIVERTSYLQARGNAEDSQGRSYEETSTLRIELIQPRIGLEIQPLHQELHRGDNLTLMVILENQGNDPLKEISLQDGLGSSAQLSRLEPGETRSWEWHTPTYQDLAGMVQVKALDGRGHNMDASRKFDARVLVPCLDLAIEPREVMAYVGDRLQFRWTLSNTGEEDLENLTFSGQGMGSCRIKDLAPGAAVTMNATMNAQISGPVKVSASGWGRGIQVIDSDQIELSVIAPSIHLQIIPQKSEVLPGKKANITCRVTNDGQDRLRDIVLTLDSKEQMGRLESLEPGESRDLPMEMAFAGHRSLSFRIAGLDSRGGVWSDEAEAQVEITMAAINLAVTVPCCLIPGHMVAINCSVENRGSLPLYNIVVNSQTYGPLSVIDFLAPGDREVIMSQRQFVGDVRDTITVEGFTTSNQAVMDVETLEMKAA